MKITLETTYQQNKQSKLTMEHTDFASSVNLLLV